ncbi:MAG: hypothetical protein LCH61_04145 [Proteobacteria bacterium]|nr:hypothetical protein [Pseudomonadota bacterium]
MLRPSYNEVPQGFGPVSESSLLGTTGLTALNSGTIKASTVALGDVAAINRYGTGTTIAAGLWCGVGVVLPSDLLRREPYMLSLKGFGRFTPSAGVVLPFFGSCTSVGVNVSVTVHDILVGAQFAFGNHATADFIGCVRPSQVFDGILPANSQFVAGLAFGNPTTASIDLASYRSSISVLRAAFPDNAIDFSVN